MSFEVTATTVTQGMLTACVPLLGGRVLDGAGRGAVLLFCTAISALVANAVLVRFPCVVSPPWRDCPGKRGGPRAALVRRRLCPRRLIPAQLSDRVPDP